MGLSQCSACGMVVGYIEAVTDRVKAKLPDLLLIPEGSVTDVKQAIQSVVQEMNVLPWGSFPEWIGDCPVDEVRRAADDFEGMDSMNEAGSLLVLLMLRPSIYGGASTHASEVLWRLGFPPPPHLLNLDMGAIRSGKGPGNTRTNILEGLIAFWRSPRATPTGPTQAQTRCAELLEGAWSILRSGLHLLRQHVPDREVLPSWAAGRILMAYKSRRELTL